MIHGHKIKQLSREKNQRNALIKTLAVSLVRDEKIKTTEVKAKALRPFIERLVTKAKAGDLAARKLVSEKLGPVTAKKMVEKIAPKFKDRNGGYTRITKLDTRKTDGARMAQIEFV
ncbi:MAG: 50S ribosomal protein L17 [bacterium]